MTIQTVKTVSLYGISHALVDATCVMVLYSTIFFNGLSTDFSFAIILFYNLIAFGTQSIFGNIFDKIQKPRLCAIIGCVLTLTSALFWKYPVIAVLCAGFGNSFFHVGGGIICLKLGRGNSAIPGMYVAPGAFGLFLGILCAKQALCSPYIFAFLLFVSAVLIYLFKEEGKDAVRIINNNIEKCGFMLIVIFLLTAIAIRSFIGLSIALPWKGNIVLVSVLTLAVVLGKFTGGVIADKFGWQKVTVTALVISSPLIAYGINSPVLYILGIFFFNFTMPVTLTAISNLLPNREGFAFGLTTLALIIGAFPTFYMQKFNISNALVIFVIVLISAILIYAGLKRYLKAN